MYEASRNILQSNNPLNENANQKSSNKSKSSRRYANRDPPPRPPRQKPTNIPIFPMHITNIQGSVVQPNYSISYENHNPLEKDEQTRYQPKVTRDLVMSPLSSCPNIYGKVMKKQSTFVQTPTDDVGKSISLIASKVHLFESQSEKELSNPRKRNHLDGILTPCIVKPMVTALAHNPNDDFQSNEKLVRSENNDIKSKSTFNTFQTSVGIEPTPCSSAFQQPQSNHKKKLGNDVDGEPIPLNHDHTLKSKHLNSFQPTLDNNRHHIHSPTKLSNHQRHQSSKSKEDKKKQNSNLCSPSPSSSINSSFYKKCKLCDKCSQKFGHSNKAVGTRGETTLI